MIFKLMTGITILISALLNPVVGAGQSLEYADPDQDSINTERHAEESAAPYAEMRASIVDTDGDQFIARTEEGQEFRLPMEGAPENVNVGDELRLVPDSDSQTIQIFKAEPSETEASGKADTEI